MRLKVLANIAAITLFVAYFAPVAIKLKEIPLVVVLVGGFVLAGVDAWQSFSDRNA